MHRDLHSGVNKGNVKRIVSGYVSLQMGLGVRGDSHEHQQVNGEFLTDLKSGVKTEADF